MARAGWVRAHGNLLPSRTQFGIIIKLQANGTLTRATICLKVLSAQRAIVYRKAINGNNEEWPRSRESTHRWAGMAAAERELQNGAVADEDGIGSTA